jgi:Glycosyl hydrolase family 115/Gylcosyl hydrolase family 115 C-terminal domain
MVLKYFNLCCCCSLLFIYSSSLAQINKNTLAIIPNSTPGSFPLFSNSVTPVFYYDAKDAKVVKIAAEAFAKDIGLIAGKQIKLNTDNKVAGNYSIIAGTIGQSKLIDELIKSKAVNVTAIKNKWECFTIQVIKGSNNSKNSKLPFRGGGVIIAGSDRRGTAFGIFHLSRLMGISPFVWWADAAPQKKEQLFISGSYTSVTPSIQYRGIFINDEDWGMQPWAAKNMDTDIKDIGPKTYAKIFELLLRLKANYIWPAMHPCTKAFYYYKQNPKVADDYAIVVGGSHCEPMLRNNVCEWAETYEEEYKKKPGEWRYDVNKDEIYKYWDDRIKEAVNYESVFTVGMRGVHDGSMPGPKDPNEKVKLLEKVITDQREILQNNFKKPSSSLPQIFVPYKEVLSLYRRGMKLPDDVTIIWPDDNYGYIRQLPNEAEQQRSGGHGVYYHLSYWGSPHDYLWLSSVSPALIGYEMKKAYDYGAKKLWVFNVGDIKPAELEMQFAMDMAWDIKTYKEDETYSYFENWATELFGANNASAIWMLKDAYYHLAEAGKPEHVGMLTFTKKEMEERIEEYNILTALTATCKRKIPASLQDAFYQLIEYPVTGAALMNKKIFYEKMARLAVAENNADEAKKYLQKAQVAFDSIKITTAYYNSEMATGKWNGMMSWHPRDLKVFNAPVAFDSIKVKIDSVFINKETDEAGLVDTKTAWTLNSMQATQSCKLLDRLGVSGWALAAKDSGEATINYPVKLAAGKYRIVVKCLPAFAMEKEKQLLYSILMNEEAPQLINVNAEAESTVWKENVVRGYSQGITQHVVTSDGLTNIRIILKNKNLALSQIEIYKAP